MPLPPVPCLFGPTASGKTEVGILLARRLGAEVIQADAFSLYRNMPILTAAPTAPPDVPHHLVGVQDPAEPFSAARFVEEAERIETDLRARGGTPLMVCGTALYLRAWLKGFGAPVPRDEAYRTRLQAREGSLHTELQRVDPKRAAQLHPNDHRRIIRALEIVRATGRPASEQREEWSGPDRRLAVLIALVRDRDDLDRRIARRTECMFEDGVVEEARALLRRPLSPEAANVLGLQDLEALLRGDIDENEAKARIAQKTRRFARKQLTFFRSFEGVHVIEAAEDAPAESLAAEAAAVLGQLS